jgi:hypothetical protein
VWWQRPEWLVGSVRDDGFGGPGQIDQQPATPLAQSCRLVRSEVRTETTRPKVVEASAAVLDGDVANARPVAGENGAQWHT